ncbi:MAG: hypothetical protein WD491_00325 [Balneolales bacterium]
MLNLKTALRPGIYLQPLLQVIGNRGDGRRPKNREVQGETPVPAYDALVLACKCFGIGIWMHKGAGTGVSPVPAVKVPVSKE